MNKFIAGLVGFCAITATVLFYGNSALAADSILLPNDTFYGAQWYMDAMRMPEAWSQTASSSGSGVVVAMIDAGVDDTHPDLRGVLWENADEIPGNGIDDDGNGYIDDMHGWNFVTDKANTRPVSSLFLSPGAWEHGTAVASLIAGRGNDDIGIAGVAWRAKIMPLVILGADGTGGTERLVKAIKYAVDKRADIVNLSVEGKEQDPEVSDAIREATAKGVLVVVAAGNGQNGVGFDLNAKPLYPSCDQGASKVGVLTVTAIKQDETRYESANYGNCVSVSAPGAHISAARPTYDADGSREEVSGYGVYSGTSLSAPLVSGVAALLKAQHPEWNGEQLAERIIRTAKKWPKGVTGLGVGELDAAAATAPADPRVFGGWNLFASDPGKSPRVWITDVNGKTIYDFQIGDVTDKRGYRAAFVHWDGDRFPDILVTAKGDENGAWRVYRRDGVLVAAGTVSRDMYDKVRGGLLMATQDIQAAGRERILFTEAMGKRIWLMDPGKTIEEPIVMAETDKPLGSLAVGIERPSQAMIILTREQNDSRLSVLDPGGVVSGTNVTTTKPASLDLTAGRQRDGREVIRLTQSGPPSYLVERNGSMKPAKTAAVVRWKQAPQGLYLFGIKGFRFYDSWPR